MRGNYLLRYGFKVGIGVEVERWAQEVLACYPAFKGADFRYS